MSENDNRNIKMGCATLCALKSLSEKAIATYDSTGHHWEMVYEMLRRDFTEHSIKEFYNMPNPGQER